MSRVTVIFYNNFNDKKYISFSTIEEAAAFIKLVRPGYKHTRIKGVGEPRLFKKKDFGHDDNETLENATEHAEYTVGIQDDY